MRPAAGDPIAKEDNIKMNKKECRQRNSGIGGQAVLEGVMMRNGEDYAIAVRKSDGSIVLKKEKYRGFFADSPLKKIPFIRGVFVFIDSMVLGLRCTDYSATVYAEDDPEEAKELPAGAETKKNAAGEEERKTAPGSEIQNLISGAQSTLSGAEAKKNAAGEGAKPQETETQAAEKEPLWERVMMGGVMAVSFALAIGLFVVLPYFAASHVVRFIGNTALLSLFEGIIRIAIFVLYIVLISQMKDIRRLFMYHGAEHKCINCIEGGRELTVENAAKATRLHKRCGSSFILFVMLVSIVLFFFIRVSNPVARVALRILLLPVISGISYELIRVAGRSRHPLLVVLLQIV